MRQKMRSEGCDLKRIGRILGRSHFRLPYYEEYGHAILVKWEENSGISPFVLPVSYFLNPDFKPQSS